MDIDRATEAGWSPRGASASNTTPPATTSSSGAAAPVAEDNADAAAAAGVSAEWSGARGALAAEVELRLHSSSARPAAAAAAGSSDDAVAYNHTRNGTHRDSPPLSDGGSAAGGAAVVHAEEALIVLFVLLLWIAAVVLFINRWGKIRMLEPYQPKFQQQHRASFLADPSPAPPLLPAPATLAAHHRLSLSRGCGSCGDYTLNVSGDGSGGGSGGGVSGGCRQTYLYLAQRPRQNSVFAGSAGAMALIPESPARRSRSVADLNVLLPPGTESPPRYAVAAAGANHRYFAVTDV